MCDRYPPSGQRKRSDRAADIGPTGDDGPERRLPLTAMGDALLPEIGAAAFAELAAFFTDAVYHNIPLAPVTGREAIANTIASFIRSGPPGIEGIEFRVIDIAADGPVVMTERVDVFRLSLGATQRFCAPIHA